MLNDYQKGKVGKTKENCNYYKDPNSPDFKGKKENSNRQIYTISSSR
jgi:hypothetical protein